MSGGRRHLPSESPGGERAAGGGSPGERVLPTVRGRPGGRVGSAPPTGPGPDAMVGPAAVEARRFAPDPERIRAGWEHRFVAAGERAEEMIALYRELGFEVVADPVANGDVTEGCLTCFAGAEEYRCIYTRRPRGA